MVSFFLSGIAVMGPTPGGFDINSILTYLGLGAGGVTAWKVVSLLLDKIVPSRSDKRSDVESTFQMLSSTIALFSAEKTADAAALAVAKARADKLELDSSTDYETIRTLRELRDELERRIAQKNEHIRILGERLAAFGATVRFDGNGTLHIDTHTGPVRTVR